MRQRDTESLCLSSFPLIPPQPNSMPTAESSTLRRNTHAGMALAPLPLREGEPRELMVLGTRDFVHRGFVDFVHRGRHRSAVATLFIVAAVAIGGCDSASSVSS